MEIKREDVRVHERNKRAGRDKADVQVEMENVIHQVREINHVH